MVCILLPPLLSLFRAFSSPFLKTSGEPLRQGPDPFLPVELRAPASSVPVRTRREWPRIMSRVRARRGDLAPPQEVWRIINFPLFFPPQENFDVFFPFAFDIERIIILFISIFAQVHEFHPPIIHLWKLCKLETDQRRKNHSV